MSSISWVLPSPMTKQDYNLTIISVRYHVYNPLTINRLNHLHLLEHPHISAIPRYVESHFAYFMTVKLIKILHEFIYFFNIFSIKNADNIIWLRFTVRIEPSSP